MPSRQHSCCSSSNDSLSNAWCQFLYAARRSCALGLLSHERLPVIYSEDCGTLALHGMIAEAHKHCITVLGMSIPLLPHGIKVLAAMLIVSLCMALCPLSLHIFTAMHDCDTSNPGPEEKQTRFWCWLRMNASNRLIMVIVIIWPLCRPRQSSK